MPQGRHSTESHHYLDDYIACPDCDLLYQIQPLPQGEVAQCHRCRAVLYRGGEIDLEATLAWSLSTLILFVIANLYPILTINISGRLSQATFWQAVQAFAEQGMWILTLVLFLVSIAIPLFRILSHSLLLWHSWRGRETSRFHVGLFRWSEEMMPWSMLEIYLLGLLVALVKLGDLADVVVGIAFLAFCLLILSSTFSLTRLDRFHLWRILVPGERPR